MRPYTRHELFLTLLCPLQVLIAQQLCCRRSLLWVFLQDPADELLQLFRPFRAQIDLWCLQYHIVECVGFTLLEEWRLCCGALDCEDTEGPDVYEGVVFGFGAGILLGEDHFGGDPVVGAHEGGALVVLFG